MRVGKRQGQRQGSVRKRQVDWQAASLRAQPMANRRHAELESATHFDPGGCFFRIFPVLLLLLRRPIPLSLARGMSKISRRGTAAACDWNDPVFGK